MSNIDLVSKFESLVTDFSGPVPEPEIALAEQKLGVLFPASYRLFLRCFGAASLVPPYEIFGITSERLDGLEPPQWSQVVADTLSMRHSNFPSLVFISSDGCDTSYCLDTSCIDSQGECPVVALGPGQDCVVVAKSFADFVDLAASGRLAASA